MLSSMSYNELTLATPAMMFPAISLLLLAYTNRFLTLSNRVRTIFNQFEKHQDETDFLQIASLRKRLSLIRWTQLSGVISLLLCVVVMFFIFVGFAEAAKMTFGVSLLLMIVSLVLSVLELNVSNETLNILLSKIEDNHNKVDEK